jgi:hypothetical protein
MVRAHQPGESTFKSILPEQVEWQSFPAFPRQPNWLCWLVIRLGRALRHPGQGACRCETHAPPTS